MEARLAECLELLDRDCGLSRIAPELLDALSDHLLAAGKRLRPKLLLLAYCGYAPRCDPDIWKPAVALEMFHAFALIHDDLVDESPVRRGRPAMQVALGKIATEWGETDAGRKLAMLAGDVLYSMAIRTFLSFRGDPRRMQAALELLMLTAVRTGAGAFAEVLARSRAPEAVTREQVMSIQGLKTSEYSFSCPLQVGAMLAGAAPGELGLLEECGRALGAAFQMQDDLEDLLAFCTGSAGSDRVALAEAKLTIPMWWAWQEASEVDRRWLRRLYGCGRPGREDLSALYRLLERTQALERTRRETALLAAEADRLALELSMRLDVMETFRQYIGELLPSAVVSVSCGT
jgi:geranylgeranyl diphosphate synthase type I